MKSYTIKTSDGQRVAFDQYKNGFGKVVIIAHGFFNSKDAELLRILGDELSDEYDVISMDFRGHGKSGGLFYWTSKEFLDLEAVLEFAKKDYDKIGVIGFSLGAATSMITASRSGYRDVINSLIAVSGPTEFWKIEYRFWEIDFENDVLYNWFGRGKAGKRVFPGPFWQKKDRPIDCAEKIKCPVLYIHGEADWLIKPWHSQEMFQRTQSRKKLALIKNGPHAEYLIRKNKNETMGIIKSWFTETM